MKYEIFLVPFPFDDLSATKVRPVVCLTEPVGHHRHIVVSFITSQIPNNLLSSDIVIRANHPQFAKTNLQKSSTIRLHRLMTITTKIIRRRLGVLPANLQKQISKQLILLFDL